MTRSEVGEKFERITNNLLDENTDMQNKPMEDQWLELEKPILEMVDAGDMLR